MIKTVEIDSIGKAMELIEDQEFNPEIQRMRSAYFYRGLPDKDYNLTTSLRMNCKHLHKELEPAVLRAFTKYASIEDPALNDSVWRQMIIGQHHGLPTRLMDWTRSPLIALHFATTEENFDKMDRRDSVVWRIDMRDVNRNLPEKYRRALEENHAFVFSVDSLMQVADNLDTYDADMGAGAMASIEPPSVDQRIINQYSFFSIVPNGMTDIEDFLDKCTTRTVRFVIRKEIRWDVRDLLDQLNINERILYPGLDGLSKSLARHYYVKNGKEQMANGK
ncbi:MAG: FRG domain-containing protein [Clostridia bacterium]|nr:FRG domain-containing protein [Clostridia bacterium]